jgi:sigma-54-dependent transcriptional regulator
LNRDDTGGASKAVSLLDRIHTSTGKLRDLVEYAVAVAPTPYSVLIEGETGTGKELFARGIHAASKRTGPFVPLNCSAVPDNMFEAELFGARRGAYTGLEDERPGLFAVADRGTLFLDEVADLPPAMQAKLLRVLEDGEIRPLGATKSMKVDVRIIAATHKYLKPLVDASRFRSDLFFRLSASCIRIPPVRERPEDIPQLVLDAVETACRVQDVPLCKVSDSAMAKLTSFSWPGNIREINNVVAAAVLNARGGTLRSEHFSLSSSPQGIPVVSSTPIAADRPFFEALQVFERAYVSDLLRRADGNVSAAARISGLSRSAVRSKAREYGLIKGGDTGNAPRQRSRVRKGH